MNSQERLLAALDRRAVDRVPTFEWFIDPSVSLSLCQSDDPIEVAERLDLDAVNVRADYAKNWISKVEYRDEWGMLKQLTGDVLPASRSHPIADVTHHSSYTFPNVDTSERLKTLERAVTRYDGKRGVVFNLRDGFSEMRDLLGYENSLMAALLEPAAYSELLQRAIAYNVALATLAVKRYGIKVIATTDDVCSASGPLFSHKTYRSVLYPAFRDVVAGFRALGVHVIKHCDGDTRPFAEMWIDAGITCLDPIDPVAGLDMGTMRTQYGDRICLKGNIDCTGHLCSGTPEQVDAEVRTCINGAGKVGIIISSSNTVHRGVRPENYRAMIDAVRKYGEANE